MHGCIDVHHHFAPPRYVSELMSRKLGERPVLEWTPRKSIEDMDRAQVATSITSITEPGIRFGDDDAARRLARECNEYAARLVEDYRGRFGVFASLPLPDIESSLRELEYALDTLHADGVILYTSYDGKYPGHPDFKPLMAELNRRNTVALLHPRRIDCCQDLIPDVSASTIEFAAETCRGAANLLFSGTASSHPDIRFILPYAGGAVPFLIERFVRVAARPDVASRLPKGLLHELRKFYYDTAQSSNPGAMSSLMKLVPVSQVLFGTDFPYRSARDPIEGLNECGLFSADDLRTIVRENALSLLPRLGTPSSS